MSEVKGRAKEWLEKPTDCRISSSKGTESTHAIIRGLLAELEAADIKIEEVSQHYLNVCKVADHEAERSNALEAENAELKASIGQADICADLNVEYYENRLSGTITEEQSQVLIDLAKAAGIAEGKRQVAEEIIVFAEEGKFNCPRPTYVDDANDGAYENVIDFAKKYLTTEGSHE